MALDVPLTFVPLDATNDVPVPPDFAEILAADHAAAGADIAYEMYERSPFLTEGTSFWDTLAAVLLTQPGMAGWEDVDLEAQTSGASAGRLVRQAGSRQATVAMSANRDAFMAALLAALRRGEPRPQPFMTTGTLTVTWDGEVCAIEGTPPPVPGLAWIELVNAADGPVSLLLAGAVAPRTWADVVTFAESADLDDPAFVVPDWIVQVGEGAQAEPGATSTSLAGLPAGRLGAMCVTGEWPDLDFVDGGSFTLGE